ncbi:MAG: translation elongation factor Ts [Candidatus Aureabacteria bacterium]|nr:translation elongation factor Ts [Candidatus Auribacterota bacterium]
MEITVTLVKELRNKTSAGMMDCKKALMETSGDMEQAVDVLRTKGLAAISKRSAKAAKEGLMRIKISADGKKAAMVEINCETDFVANNDKFKVFADKALDIVFEKSKEVIGQKEVTDLIGEVGASFGENIKIGRAEVLSTEGSFVSYIHLDNKLGVIVELSAKILSPEIERVGKDITLQVAASNPACVSAQDASKDIKDILDRERKIYKEQVKDKPANIIDKIVEGKVAKFLKQICLLDQPFVKDPEVSVKKYLQEKSKTLGEEISVKSFVRIRIGEE